MGWGVFTCRRFRTWILVAVVIMAATIGTSSAALAQTTLVLSEPNSQVTDTTIRNGPYATVNQDGPLLLTRFSSVPEWERRSVLSFETTPIPLGSVVSSAILRLTVKSGLGASGTTRPVTAYRLTTAFTETQATWMNRQTTVPWGTPGGDLESYGTRGSDRRRRAGHLHSDRARPARRERRVRSASDPVGTRRRRGRRQHQGELSRVPASESSTTGSRPTLTVVYGPPTTPGIIDVPAGGDLQQALNQVQRGGTVRLASGATFVGNFVLPAKSGGS